MSTDNFTKSATTVVPPQDDHVTTLAEVFRLMGDPTRLRIILACLGGPRAVGDIAAELSLSPSLASHHLRLLRAARVLRCDRDGRRMLYSLADAHVSRMVSDMLEHVLEPDETEAA